MRRSGRRDARRFVNHFGAAARWWRAQAVTNPVEDSCWIRMHRQGLVCAPPEVVLERGGQGPWEMEDIERRGWRSWSGRPRGPPQTFPRL